MVTNEDPKLVDAFMQKYKPTVPLVITGNQGFDNALGVDGFPTHAVVGPDGKLAYSGHSSESALSDALGEAKKGSIYPSKFAKVLKAMREGDVPKAYAEVRKLADAAKAAGETSDPWLGRFLTWIEERAASDLALARALATEGRVHSAHALAQPYALSKTAFPVTQEAGGFVKELEARAAFQEELKAGPLFDEAAALEEGYEFTAAVDGYRKVYKKYGATPIGELAKKRAQEIVEKGLPGMNTDCDPCRKAKRACGKHKEDVKL